MRAFIQSTDLAAALKHSVASANSPMESLRCAHLFTDGPDQVVLETTDTITYRRTVLPARVDIDGAILFNAAMLAPVAAAAGEIALRDTGELQRGRSRYRLAARSATEWTQQQDDDWSPADIDPVALATAITSVAAAAADDSDIRAYLRGVHIGKGLVWCADGFHIAVTRIAYAGPDIVIPAQPLRAVLGLLQEGARIEVSGPAHQAARLRVTHGGEQASVRLLDTKPIDIQGMVANTRSLAPGIVVRRAEFIAGLRRFMPFAFVTGDRKALPTVIYQFQGGHLTLADRTEESVEALDDALVEGAGTWRAGVNPRLLQDAVTAIGGELIRIEPPAPKTSGGNAVWRLYPAGANPSEFAHYVAPITL